MVDTKDIILSAADKLDEAQKRISESKDYLNKAAEESGERQKAILDLADSNLVWAVEHIADVRQVATYAQRGCKDAG